MTTNHALNILDDYFDKQSDEEFFLEIDKDDARTIRRELEIRKSDMNALKNAALFILNNHGEVEELLDLNKAIKNMETR